LGTGGPGVSPGLSSLEALRSARRTLADAEARIRALMDERTWVEREIATWTQIADRMGGLVAYYEARLNQPALLDALPAPSTESTSTTSRPRSESGETKPSVDRFGKFVKPVADALIGSRGRAVPVEDIYKALPEDIRTELDAASSTYSTPFRIRRMFRRNKGYTVTDEGVAFAAMMPKPLVPENASVVHFARRKDGSTAAVGVAGHDGKIIYVKPTDVRDAIRMGRKIMLPEMSGRRSVLRLAGGRFYSESEGKENNDFESIPEVPADDISTA
jgi:hypothetical protein